MKKINFKIPAKSFLSLLIEHMGADAWERRKQKLKSCIRVTEKNIDITHTPIEWQLFKPPTKDKISWYMLLVDILDTEQFSDDPFESHRIYPIFSAIGDQIDNLKNIPNVNKIFEKLVSSKQNQPDNILFELLIASHYLRNGYEVSFIKESSLLKTPDLSARKGELEISIECKRLKKITHYSEEENKAWKCLWHDLSLEMLNSPIPQWIDLTFKKPPSKIASSSLLNAYKELSQNHINPRHYNSELFEIYTNNINTTKLNDHFSKNFVRANSPQIQSLIFGDLETNEKRETAVIPKEIIRPGQEDNILNIFIKEIETCTGAQWRCTSPESLDKRSKHFKTTIREAVDQIPENALGAIHTFYETFEGSEIESIRRNKLIQALSGFQVEKNLVGVFIHGVNIYPGIESFEWAETVQYFTGRAGIVDELFEHVLILGFAKPESKRDETHWEQDILAKKIKKQST